MLAGYGGVVTNYAIRTTAIQKVGRYKVKLKIFQGGQLPAQLILTDNDLRTGEVIVV